MAVHRSRRRRDPGVVLHPVLPPGSVHQVLAPESTGAPTRLEIMAYGPDGLEEMRLEPPEGIGELRARHPVVWANLDGAVDARLAARLGDAFGIHPLALEDMTNTHQRPKAESYGDHLYFVCRMLTLRDGAIQSEQLNLYFGPGFLLTIQQIPGDCLDPVRQRLRQGGSIRSRGPDYLAYAIIDAVIDAYFPILEDCGDRLEELEEEVLGRPQRDYVRRIHLTVRELLTLRRAAWPLREAVNTLLRDPHPLVLPETRIFLRDCSDHTVQVIDLLENYRELAAGLRDVYLSTLGHRTNEIMRLLTVISTIFIPLTFLAGVWGMNFDPDVSPWNLPELRWFWGYPMALGIMATIGGGLLVYFRFRGWLGSPAEREAESGEERRRGARPATPENGGGSGAAGDGGHAAEQKRER